METLLQKVLGELLAIGFLTIVFVLGRMFEKVKALEKWRAESDEDLKMLSNKAVQLADLHENFQKLQDRCILLHSTYAGIGPQKD